MQLIKFLGHEYTGPNFPYANKFAWMIVPGIYCDINTDIALLKKIGGVFMVIESGGYVTFGNTLLSQKALAIKWLKQNYNFIFECSENFVDTVISEKLLNIEALSKYNSSYEEPITWTSNDILHPAMSIGNIIISSTESEKLNNQINWLATNGYDTIYTELLSADSYTSDSPVNSCGCNNIVPSMDSGVCSAAEIYKNYMNKKTINILSDPTYIHNLFIYTINNQEFINDKLKDTLIDFLRAWRESNNITINNQFNCPCTSNNSDHTQLVDNIIKAINWIGSDDEYSHKTFISFWFRKLAEELVSTF